MPGGEKWLAAVREKSGAESPAYATELAVFGLDRLQRKKWDEAETVLRESLAIRLARVPDDWTTFNIRSQLGGALLGQGKYGDAEPLLMEGYTGMKERQAKIPPDGRIRLTESLQRLVQLYDSWGKPAEAAMITGTPLCIDAASAVSPSFAGANTRSSTMTLAPPSTSREVEAC